MNEIKLSDICIFTRSYSGDREFLPYLYASIEKHCSDWGEVVLVVEDRDYQAIRDYVPAWVKIVLEDSFAPGAIQQKYTKITADFHTHKSYVFHIDSDSVFTRKVSITDLSRDGRPFLEYSSYDHLLKYQNGEQGVSELKKYCLENVIPQELRKELAKMGVSDFNSWMDAHLASWLKSNFDSWFADFFERWQRLFGVDIWREGTTTAIGLEVNHEFSRRPEKLYPRELYPAARSHLERVHGLPFKEFIRTRVGRQQGDTEKRKYFSDLNYLGAYLFNFMPSRIEWVDIELHGYGFRPSFVKQFISFDLLESGSLKSGAAELIGSAINGG